MNFSLANIHMRRAITLTLCRNLVVFYCNSISILPSNLPSLFFGIIHTKRNARLVGNAAFARLPLFLLLPHLSEVEVLLRDTAPDEWRLGARVVNVLEQNLGGRVGDGHGLGGGNLLIDVRTGLLVDGLELLLGGHGPVENVLLQALDGVVGASHALDLLTGTVRGSGVGHGVTSIPVGDILKNHRAVVGISPLLAVLDSRLDSETVHAVDLETRDVLATLVVVCESGRPVGRCTHTVLVVCSPVSFLPPLFPPI